MKTIFICDTCEFKTELTEPLSTLAPTSKPCESSFKCDGTMHLHNVRPEPQELPSYKLWTCGKCTATHSCDPLPVCPSCGGLTGYPVIDDKTKPLTPSEFTAALIRCTDALCVAVDGMAKKYPNHPDLKILAEAAKPANKILNQVFRRETEQMNASDVDDVRKQIAANELTITNTEKIIKQNEAELEESRSVRIKLLQKRHELKRLRDGFPAPTA